ncbi:unnamed protein product [Cunninghamella blakesleeana]
MDTNGNNESLKCPFCTILLPNLEALRFHIDIQHTHNSRYHLVEKDTPNNDPILINDTNYNSDNNNDNDGIDYIDDYKNNLNNENNLLYGINFDQRMFQFMQRKNDSRIQSFNKLKSNIIYSMPSKITQEPSSSSSSSNTITGKKRKESEFNGISSPSTSPNKKYAPISYDFGSYNLDINNTVEFQQQQQEEEEKEEEKQLEYTDEADVKGIYITLDKDLNLYNPLPYKGNYKVADDSVSKKYKGRQRLWADTIYRLCNNVYLSNNIMNNYERLLIIQYLEKIMAVKSPTNKNVSFGELRNVLDSNLMEKVKQKRKGCKWVLNHVCVQEVNYNVIANKEMIQLKSEMTSVKKQIASNPIYYQYILPSTIGSAKKHGIKPTDQLYAKKISNYSLNLYKYPSSSFSTNNN